MARGSVVTAALALGTAALASAGPADMATIKQRLLASYALQFNVSGADEDVTGYLPLIEAPGIFSDLNYSEPIATGWGGYTHCERMAEMGQVYVTNSSKWYGSAQVKNALLGSTGVFRWFLLEQPQDTGNWWYQMIGCGKPVAQLALQFQSQLSTEQAANATTLMDRAQWVSFTHTGTNAADIALVHIGNGLLNDNETMVAEAFGVLWSTVQYSDSPAPSSPEGPKPDGSYMQHGPQLYLGNYGASWTKDALSNVALSAGTIYNASQDAYEVATHVTLDGCQKAMHIPSLQWDVAVIGRQVTNPGGQNVMGAGGDTGLLVPQVLRAAGGTRAAELNAFADLLENPAGHAMPADFAAFYNSDFAVQRRPNYYASLRMISARTAGGECINGQGLQALHAADGVFYVMKTGNEYQNIAPTWDWQRLPGTTVQINGTQLNCSTADGNGAGQMTGVLADWSTNTTGLAFMDFINQKHGQDLNASKAAFFFDGFIMFLGAGIRTAPGFRVETTLDSRLLDSAGVVASANGGTSFKPVPKGRIAFPLPASPSAPALFHHQDMGFAVVSAAAGTGSLSVLADDVTGNWSSVGTYPGPPVTNGMFTLGLDHGTPPVNDASYVYAVWPDVQREAFTTGAWKPALANFQVWSNTPQLQAVYDAANNTLFAAAYSNATAVKVPAALGVESITPPMPAAFVAKRYRDAASGNDTLSIAFTDPGSYVTATLGRTYPFYWQTALPRGTSFVPCSWPDCPGQWPMPKGYKGPQSLKFDCFANGTIHYNNPPGDPIPPMNCVFANASAL